ncbi:hypothetical protein DK37_14570 [Halomonas sp. SUBG004]|nr:hypothetical protein DK37_14570 [Halomonas sp. SUBG004]
MRTAQHQDVCKEPLAPAQALNIHALASTSMASSALPLILSSPTKLLLYSVIHNVKVTIGGKSDTQAAID